MYSNFANAELTSEQFARIKHLLHRVCGIDLQTGKEGLVKSRLLTRLKDLNLLCFDQYIDCVESDPKGSELALMVDALTTNKTSFFREVQHFDFLRESLLPALTTKNKRLRFWSAACSSGEEPYSLAITLCDALPAEKKWDAKILATDICQTVLSKAREATYKRDFMQDVPHHLLHRYFTQNNASFYSVNPDARSLVHFARLNLLGPWPMSGLFDVIFCRNVMIYFDKSTRQELVQRFYEVLQPGGFLMVGHSESLMEFAGNFHYVRPAVYKK